MQHVKSGRLKAIAGTGARRHLNRADLPTFQEAGVADFVCGVWFGLFAPAATPPDIVKRLSGVIWDAVSSRDFVDNVLLKIGFDLDTAIAPERFPAFLREDRQRWKEAVARIDPAKFKP